MEHVTMYLCGHQKIDSVVDLATTISVQFSFFITMWVDCIKEFVLTISLPEVITM